MKDVAGFFQRLTSGCRVRPWMIGSETCEALRRAQGDNGVGVELWSESEYQEFSFSETEYLVFWRRPQLTDPRRDVVRRYAAPG